ncbi:MAG: hypothetical protein QOI83_3509 [Streptomycetaceae bacterium]|nr:hypothetical protein [Streptomycetaceae bacterium]
MAEQADFFLSKITLRAGDILALDWEDPEVTCAEKDAWIRYVQKKEPGHRVILYCNYDYWTNCGPALSVGDGLWSGPAIAEPCGGRRWWPVRGAQGGRLGSGPARALPGRLPLFGGAGSPWSPTPCGQLVAGAGVAGFLGPLAFSWQPLRAADPIGRRDQLRWERSAARAGSRTPHSRLRN